MVGFSRRILRDTETEWTTFVPFQFQFEVGGGGRVDGNPQKERETTQRKRTRTSRKSPRKRRNRFRMTAGWCEFQEKTTVEDSRDRGLVPWS